MQHLLGTHHQSGEVKIPLGLTGYVGAVDVAELALEALVDDLVLLGWSHRRCILFWICVDELEEGGKRTAKLETESAPMAEVVDPSHFFSEVGLDKVFGVQGVVGGGHRILQTVTGGRACRSKPALVSTRLAK
jgi:hypothetical protein